MSALTLVLTLLLSNTTPSSVSLLPILLALNCRTLNCRTLNVLSSLFSADGTGVGDGEGGDGVDCWVFEDEQGSHVKSLFLRYCAAFKSLEHFACSHPESVAPVAYSSTSDASGTYRAGILSSMPWIRMYVARHQKDRSGRRHSGFVVELSIRSAAAN